MSDFVRPAKPVAPSVDSLHETINKHIEASKEQTAKMLFLTKVMLGFTIACTMLAGAQLWLAYLVWSGH